MSWLSLILLSFANLRVNKFRSFLTVIGMVFGTGAVIATLSSNEGAARYIKKQLESLGTNVMSIVPMPQGGRNFSSTDKAHLMKYSSYISEAAFTVTAARKALVSFGSSQASAKLIGVEPTFFKILKTEIARGRVFDSIESRNQRAVAVVGGRVAREIFGKTNPMGGRFKMAVAGSLFNLQVIGVLSERGGQGGALLDNGVFLPLGLVEKVAPEKLKRRLSLALHNEDHTEKAKEQTWALLAPRFPSGLKISDAKEAIERTKSIWGKQNLVGICLAFISLLTGGVGIMNIMLLSVTQRKKEIGLRKAVGAKNSQILMQFLFESVTVCIVGGILGVLAGMMFGHQVAQMMGQWEAVVSMNTVLMALGFATLTGIVFGIAPAYRASQLDPYEALRA